MSGSQSKVIILTGASRGIGAAIANTLLSQRHNLVLLARTHSALADFQTKYPSQVEILPGDITDPELGAKAVEIATKRWSRLDAVIVNHGTLDPVRKVADVGVDEWRRAFDVNVFGGIALIQPAIPHLRTAHGRIILVSSGAAVSAYQGWGPYGATKAALNHLAQTLGVEEPAITTVSVRPGVVDTEMQREIREVHAAAMSEGDRAKFAGLKTGGKLLRADQPGNVIAGLAVGAGRDLSGRFVSWDDEVVKEFRGE